MEIVFDAIASNESFARVAVAAFVTHMNPTLEELSDIKTAVSEAVTNAIIHGYENIGSYGEMRLTQKEPMQKEVTQKDPTQKEPTQKEPAQHELPQKDPGKVRLYCRLEGQELHIQVTDQGKGIEDIEKAMEPLFTTKPELERSGMGFAFMEAFMDELKVSSTPGEGTCVYMKKRLGTNMPDASEE